MDDNRLRTGKADGMDERTDIDEERDEWEGEGEPFATGNDDGEDDALVEDVPAWVGAATAAGLALVVVEALVLVGTFTQGLAVEGLDGDFLHKIGVAFLSNIGRANGLAILVAAVLVALPSLLRAPTTEAQDRRRALALAIGAVLALLLVLATPVAVRARLHVLDVSGQSVDSLARRVLATYTVGTLGTAAVALAACLGFARIGPGRGTPDDLDDDLDDDAGDDDADATVAAGS